MFADTKSKLNSVLETVIRKLCECGLTVNFSKCSFYDTEVEYLGFKISRDGVKPLEDKVEAIKKLQVPSNVSELRSLLGSIVYYRVFIRYM